MSRPRPAGLVIAEGGATHTSQDYELRGAYSLPDDETQKGIGWVTFAALMLGLAGIWNFVAGVLAIADSRVYAGEHQFVFSNLNTWGWIILVLGIVQGLAAVALLSGSEFARWFAIGAAALNAIGQLMYVPVYPWWAIAMFSVDALIIYALAVYGGHRLRQTI
jgi:hypothetical protein